MNILNLIAMLLISIPTLPVSASEPSARAGDAVPEIINLGADFQKYWSEIKRKRIQASDLAAHVKVFKEKLVRNREQFYLDVVFDKREAGKSFDEVLIEALKESIPIFEKHRAQIEFNISSFESSTRDQIKKLKRELPDFKVDTPIYGMISLDKFAGGVRLHEGKQLLAISFDKLAAIDRDFAMVFSHEAFHVYHHQANPTMREELKTSNDLLVAGMFIEGIATFAEGELNPDRRQRRMVRDLEEWCRSKSYRKFINDFLADNKKLGAATFEANKNLYRKWFYTSRDQEYPFPTEAAYCIGDQVVAELHKKHSLSEMVRWNVSKMIDISKPVLKNLGG